MKSELLRMIKYKHVLETEVSILSSEIEDLIKRAGNDSARMDAHGRSILKVRQMQYRLLLPINPDY